MASDSARGRIDRAADALREIHARTAADAARLPTDGDPAEVARLARGCLRAAQSEIGRALYHLTGERLCPPYGGTDGE